MTVFYLPDLGEGLPDAEIRSWYIHVGDVIKTDEPMVAMETAKAVVDIPAPFGGKVIQLYGKSGDIIKTGEALIDIRPFSQPSDGLERKANALSPLTFDKKSSIEGEDKSSTNHDKATVVGNLQTSNRIVEESATGIKPKFDLTTNNNGIKATPSIRALAKKMQIDLRHCAGTGPAGQITVSDIENAAKTQTKMTAPSILTPAEGYEPLRGVRRAMAIAMSQSHQAVVPVTLVDDADIHAWPEKTDITLRLIRAMMAACQREPRLNAWFDDKNLSLRQHQKINLGIAMDTPEGLFVPVLKNVAQSSMVNLRKTIDKFKGQIKNRSIPPEDLSDATLVLSNVGIFAGRYANPIIIPPMVAILAVGRMIDAVVAHEGTPAVHKLLPLSLTVDHRAITGGEAARFLSALIRDLQTA
ncbi:MAG: dihydrolipoamide acetyltransferase family protein [Pseudomonadota bacterium]